MDVNQVKTEVAAILDRIARLDEEYCINEYVRWARVKRDLFAIFDKLANGNVVYRIFDPVQNMYCSSGRGFYAHNGRSVWVSKGAVKNALRNMPVEIRDRLIVKEFALVEVTVDE